MYFWNFFKTELRNDPPANYQESEYIQKRENVYVFLRMPLALEKFMTYGFLQIADSFMYIFTFLPLRILLSLFHVFHNPFKILTNLKSLMEPSQIIDYFKLLLIVVCSYLLTFVDTSMIYHIIRAQTIIKLYIFFNMLEVADRLLCSIGQDILEALFWTIIEPKKNRLNIVLHFFFASIYMFAHSMVMLCCVTTLNVAFNSHNKALLTIMLSNNFVELKGSVFKKLDKNNVFLMSCTDVKERFYNLVFLLIIFIRNMAEFDWHMDEFFVLIPTFCTIFFSEFFIDWIKHAFVMKFNGLSEEVFKDYKLQLAYDFIDSRQKETLKIHYDFRSRRYGFIPIPLFCLLLRVFMQSIRITNEMALLNLFIGYLCLIGIKVLNNMLLISASCKWITNDKKSEIAKEKRLLKTCEVNTNENSLLVYNILQNEASKIRLSKNAAKKLKKKNLVNNHARCNQKDLICRQRLNTSRSED